MLPNIGNLRWTSEKSQSSCLRRVLISEIRHDENLLQVGNNQFEEVIKDISPSGLPEWQASAETEMGQEEVSDL